MAGTEAIRALVWVVLVGGFLLLSVAPGGVVVVEAQAQTSPLCSNVGIPFYYNASETTCNGTRLELVTIPGLTINGTVIFNSTSFNQTVPDCTTVQVNTLGCICPYDRVGTTCDGYREYNCSVRLVSPVGDCQPIPTVNADKLSGDPVCFRPDNRDFSSPLTFVYQLHCNFTNQTFIEEGSPRSLAERGGLNATAANFTYWALRERVFDENGLVVDNRRFALSASATLRLRFRPINFYRLSDDSLAVTSAVLTPAQVAGAANVSFGLQWSNVTAEYFAGGRVYTEAVIAAGLPVMRQRGLVEWEAARVFLDPVAPLLTDPFFLPPPPFPWYIPVAVGIGVLAITAITIACLRARRAAQGRQAQDRAVMDEVMKRLDEIRGAGKHSKVE